MAAPFEERRVPSDGPTTEAAPVDIRAYLSMLWRQKWAFVTCLVVLPLGAYLLTIREPKVYKTGATLQVQTQNVDTSLFSLDSVPPPSSLAAAARLIESTDVTRLAQQEFRKATGRPASELADISVGRDDEAGFLVLSASAGDPNTAAQSANAYAQAVVAGRARDARRQVDEVIKQLEANLARLETDPDDIGRQQLSEQLQRMRALRAAQGNNARVVAEAAPPLTPVSPHPQRNTTLAFLFAVLLGAGLVVLLERANRRVRDATELEDIVGAPLLAGIPETAFEPASGAPLRGDAREAFLMLRTSLTYFNIDRQLTRILVTSPMKGDGKTTVSVNLALAYARAGKRVTIIDADLRHPQVASRLGIETGNVGLATFLVGEATLGDVVTQVPTDAGELYVLRAGPPPPNPSELLASAAMRELLNKLESHVDIVIVDTPPALVVGDAIPLMESASGVVLVGRMSKTTRESMARLTTVVRSALGTVLGVVATGMPSTTAYGYGGYSYHVSVPENSNGAGHKSRLGRILSGPRP
jgi:capsular exopolysaccharide synthesis family protein